MKDTIAAVLASLCLTITSHAQTEAKLLTKEVHIEEVPQIAGGDADVNSKNGRTTIVRVWTDNLNNHGSYLTLDVHYSVKEGSSNNTHLQKDLNVRIDAPTGYKIQEGTEGIGRQNANFSKNWTSETHDWNDVSSEGNVTGSFFTTLSVKFDGPGRDDKGNAQMKGTLSIPVKLVRD